MRLVIFFIIEAFENIEADLKYVIIRNGLESFSSALFEYDIISSDDRDFIRTLHKHLPLVESSVVLIEIMAYNVKNPATYWKLFKLFDNVSSLHHLYKKIKILG